HLSLMSRAAANGRPEFLHNWVLLQLVQLVADPRANLEIQDDGERQRPSIWRAREHPDADTSSQSGNQVRSELAVVPLLPSFGQSHQDAQCAKHAGHTKPRNARSYAGRSQPKTAADSVQQRLRGAGRQPECHGDLDTTAPHIGRSAPHARPIARLQSALNRLVQVAKRLDDEVEDGRPNLTNLAKLPIGQPLPRIPNAIDGPVPSAREHLLDLLDGSGPVGVPQPLPCCASRVDGPIPGRRQPTMQVANRSEEHTSELQSRENLVCRLL